MNLFILIFVIGDANLALSHIEAMRGGQGIRERRGGRKKGEKGREKGTPVCPP